MKAAMRAANPTKARSKGSKGSSDNLDRMGNGGKPVVSRTNSLILEQEAMDAIDDDEEHEVSEDALNLAEATEDEWEADEETDDDGWDVEW